MTHDVSADLRPGLAPDLADREAEAQNITAVRERLLERFAQRDPAFVAAIVEQEYARLGGPIRSFVPILVEKAATERLAGAASFGLIA